jgi:hypothetical protein
LTAADASQLVMGNIGYVVGEFPGNGVWANQYGGPWGQLSAVDAVSLAGAGGGGVFAASFDQYGTFAYVTSPGAWIALSQVYVEPVATDGVDFAGVFSADYCPTIALYDRTTGQWMTASSGGVLLGVSPV